MIEDLKRTFNQTVIYSLGNVLPKLVGFILLPLYTSHLSTSEFGILAILQASSQILIGVLGFNIHTSMMRWLVIDKSIKYQKSIIYTALVSSFAISIFMCIALIPFNNQFSVLLFGHANFKSYIFLLIISSAIGIINNIPLNILRYHEKAARYIWVSVIKFVIILILNFYFLTQTSYEIDGILIAEIIGGAVLIIQTVSYTFQNINFVFNYTAFIEMFKYGFPLIFSTTSALILSLSDRFIIKYFLNDSSVGVYSLGNKIAGFINVFIIQSFQLGFLPIAFKKLQDANSKRFFVKVFTYFNLVLIFFALSLSLFSKEIITTFASQKDYWDAYTVIPVLSLAFVLRGAQYIVSLSFHYTKQTSYNAYIIMLSAIINVGLNIVFIPLLGIIGAAWSFFISQFVLLIISNYFAQKLFPLKFEYLKNIELLLLFILIYFLTQIIIIKNPAVMFALKLLLMVLFPFILKYLNFYEDVELEKIKYFLNKISKKISA
jgi:O-antigen/teichoic acid export membrane protein